MMANQNLRIQWGDNLKKKKIPLRKCVSCNESKSKKELIRVVKNKDGIISVDLTGKMNGRGAYICSKIECLDGAKENKKLNRALEIQIPDEIYDKLKDVISTSQEQIWNYHL